MRPAACRYKRDEADHENGGAHGPESSLEPAPTSRSKDRARA
jgi:hypothetical protein